MGVVIVTLIQMGQGSQIKNENSFSKGFWLIKSFWKKKILKKRKGFCAGFCIVGKGR